jgi:bifunctional DNase/RNase
MRGHLLALLLATLPACGGGDRTVVAAPTPIAIPPLTAPSHDTPPPSLVPAPPAGYVEVKVLRVAPTLGGASVELGHPDEKRVVRMLIGGTEGHSITLRMDHEEPPRPLTHDLVDAILAKLGAGIFQVQIDDLRDDIFIGTIVLRRPEGLEHIDARPSDAIALAIKARAPIYVAEKVFDKASTADDDGAGTAPPTPIIRHPRKP